MVSESSKAAGGPATPGTDKLSCWSPASGTYFVEGPPRYSFVSSTLLRERLKNQQSISDIVPEACIDDEFGTRVMKHAQLEGRCT